MGLLRFTPHAWDEVKNIRNSLTPDQKDKMHMTGTLQLIIESGKIPVSAVEYLGRWGELDSEDDLLLFQDEAGF